MHSLLCLRPRGRALTGLVLVATALATAGCGNDPVTNPDTPTPAQVTETYDGTLSINGAITQPFRVQTAGTVVATLTVIDPPTYVVDGETKDTVMGLSLGTWNGLVCTIGAPTLANDGAKVGVSLTGSATATGDYCVRVYDSGSLRQATAYQLTVTHF
jgi:hypothetical protein